MYDLNSFFERLDWFYENHQLNQAEHFMLEQLERAREEGALGARLSMMNELMGYYRTLGRYEECLKTIEEALELSEQLGLSGTIPYATTLLNAATGCRAAGQTEKACEYYEKTIAIYKEQLGPEDVRLASLYNNMSILKSDQKQYKEALDCLQKALSIVQDREELRVEEGITCTNLGLLHMNLGENEKALSFLTKSIELFEEGHTDDPHYASALAGFGEVQAQFGNLEASQEAYEKALHQIKRCYGENEAYKVTLKNLKRVQEKRNESCGN